MTPHHYNQINNNNKYSRGGLPPQYPFRRGSNTPISPLASCTTPSPNRSRSLDGLLDSTEPPVVTTVNNNSSKKNSTLIEQIPSNASQSCDELDINSTCSSTTTKNIDDEKEKIIEQSNNNNNNDLDKVSVKSNSSEKRKRNFMDRCVNKVRSFIRK